MDIELMTKKLHSESLGAVARLCARRNNERGMALIIAVSLMAIMSLLGAILLSVTTSDIQLSGNYRNQYEAFYAAERAVEYSIRTVVGSGAVDLYEDADDDGVLHRDQIAAGNSGLEDTSGSTDDRNTIVYVGTGTPPVGIGTDANLFEAKNYIVTAVGVSPVGNLHPSRAVVRSMAAKIIPK